MKNLNIVEIENQQRAIFFCTIGTQLILIFIQL